MNQLNTVANFNWISIVMPIKRCRRFSINFRWFLEISSCCPSILVADILNLLKNHLSMKMFSIYLLWNNSFSLISPSLSLALFSNRHYWCYRMYPGDRNKTDPSDSIFVFSQKKLKLCLDPNINIRPAESKNGTYFFVSQTRTVIRIWLTRNNKLCTTFNLKRTIVFNETYLLIIRKNCTKKNGKWKIIDCEKV